MTNKNLIFTVTHGRTGTTLLTNIFNIFQDTKSEHEPAPNYADIHPFVKDDPRFALDFLEKKIMKIDSFNENNYVETSNVFGKAFIVPLLRMGVVPNIVCLNREFRKVATSLFQRGSTPSRSKMGVHFSADPTKPGSLSIFDINSLTDYQMCFWGVLDSFWRQKNIETIYKKKFGKDVCWIEANELSDYDKVINMGNLFGLIPKHNAREIHASESQKHHNPNTVKKSITGIDFDQEECEVIDRIAYYEPLFIEEALDSKLIENSIREYFSATAYNN